MPKPGDDEQLKLLNEFREGGLRCRLFKTKVQGGALATFFTLGRERGKPDEPLIGGLDDLRRAKSLITQAEKELSREVSREWWSVVQAVKLIDGGAVCRVEKSLPDADKAERFAWKTPFDVFPRPSAVELQQGEELVIREGDDKRLDRQIRQLRWQEENKGTEFAFGRWHDRGSVPQVGQRVNIEALHDYQGEPRDHRVTPLTRPVEPGEPNEALYAVIRRDPKVPGMGTVEGLTRIRRDAIREKDDLQAGHDARVQATNDREWQERDFDPGLRRFGPGRDEEPPSGAPAAPPPPPKQFVVGSLRAEVHEATDAGGNRQRTVKITRTRGGAEQHFEFDLHELLEVARQVGGIEKAKGQVKERLVETSQEKDGRDGPTAEQAPKEAGRPEHRNGHVPAVGVAQDDGGPSRGRAASRDNPHWVVGVWHGAEPPKEDQPLWFATGTGRVQDRIMTPVQGEAKAPGPDGPTRYVIGKVVGDGLAIAYGSAKDLNKVVQEVGKLQRQAERSMKELHRRRNGPSMGL